jgi:transporter family-2 protein
VNQALFAAVAMLAAGAFMALQAPTNATLAQAVRSPVNAALVSFLVGSVALLVAAAALQTRPDPAAVRALPWWAWLGGAYGAVVVAAAAFATPKIGVTTTITLLVAGQFFVAVALDHFGAFGLAPRPVSLARIAGLALIGAGVFLVRR